MVKKTNVVDVNTNDAKSPNTKSNLIQNIYIIVAVSALAFIVVLLIFNQFQSQPLDDDFFVSDNTKIVVSLQPTENEARQSSSIQTYTVYTYDGDNITGLKTYFEYPDKESAKAVIDSLRAQPEFKNAVVEGKFIVVTADPDQFEGLTASDVKQQADAINQYMNQNKKDPDSQEESKSQDNSKD